MAKSSMIISEDAESVAEETAAKEDTEAVSEEVVKADEAEPVEEAEAEASAEVESEEKAEEATLAAEETAFAGEAESAAEETVAEGTTAEETTAKEDTEAVSEEVVKADEAEPVEEAEAEASAEVESEEKVEEATLAAEEAAFAGEAESAAEGTTAEETTAKEDAEAVSEEAVEAEEKGNAEAGAKPVTIDETNESKEQPVSDTIRKMTQSPVVLQEEPASSTTAESATVGGTREILTMCAKDLMQKEVIWGSPDDSVQQILTTMQQHDVGYMVVGQDGVMEGILSKSDLTGAMSPYLRSVFVKWRRPLDDATLQIKVKWIMSRPVRTIKPETSLAVIMENMGQFGGHCLAVVDDKGKVQGLVTVFDVFQALLNSNPGISSVGKTSQAPPLA